MPAIRLSLRAVIATVTVLLLAFAGTAVAREGRTTRDSRADYAPPRSNDSLLTRGVRRLAEPAPAGPTGLPAVSSNVELVGKLELKDGPFGNVVPGQIADVAVYKDFAYLNSWDTPDCQRGGLFAVDISNPATPKFQSFVPALPGNYHGEGAHVVTLDTAAFKGDVLAVNNEAYSGACFAGQPQGGGGFDLYDVTDPRNIKPLAHGVGDKGPEGELTGDAPVANSTHSVFLWQDKGKAYAVFVDNTELHDVDIFDVTDPKNPQPVAEYDFVDYFFTQSPSIDIIDDAGLNGDVFLHDMVVKHIDGKPILLADYWDAGYITVDISDPKAPKYIGDTTFNGPDPITGRTPQTGNAHQGEFSHDNRFILAADEDFTPYRADTFGITTGPNVGTYDATEVGGGTSVSFLPDRKLNGPVVYGGYGCNASADVPARSSVSLSLASGEEAIIALQRGPAFDPGEDYDGDGDTDNDPEDACFPGEKAANAAAAGWDAVLLFNRHQASGDPADDGPNCGSGGYPEGAQIVTLCTTHEAAHRIFNDPPAFGVPYDHETDLKPIGTVGDKVEGTAQFDSWGYAHLYRNQAGKIPAVDHYAAQEATDSRFAFGFGDLSIHEFATDPTENIAYSAYYAEGMRVFSFGDQGLKEEGKFIDTGGDNTFWGVEQFTTASGERLFAGSDRNSGLYILRYTGPGAPKRPSCSDATAKTTPGTPVKIPTTCTDPNSGNTVTRRVTANPSGGTATAGSDGSITYTPNSGFGGDDTFKFVGNDGAADSAPATVTVSVARSGRCANPQAGTSAADTLNGTALGDRLTGGPGDDTLRGLAGDDCLLGEAGNDRLLGNDGDDDLQGGDGNDRTDGGAGRDRILGGAGADSLLGGAGNDTLSGQAGSDTISGGSGSDRITGSTGNDRLVGGAGNDRISGGPGADRISGGSGRDTISGGNGNDRISAADGRTETINCGKGRDRVTADRTDRLRGCEIVTRRGSRR